MKRRAFTAWALLIAAVGLVTAGVAAFDWRAGLIAGGVLLAAVLFGPDPA